MTTRMPARLTRTLGVALLLASCLAGAVQAQTDACAPGIVLVKFRPGMDTTLVNRIIERHGLRLNRILPHIGAQRFRIPSGHSEWLLARLLASYPQVEYAEPDYIRYASYISNDPLLAQQWDVFNMRMPQAWDVTRGSTNVVVGVLDTGITLAHPDLASALWINTDEIPGNNIDDDHNGYVDDRNGYDFAGDASIPLQRGQDPIPNDTEGHGTHVSGTIAAQQNNGTGISGFAPLTKIMAVKVLGGILGTGYTSDIVDGITYAVDNGAKVLNMSLGGAAKSMAEYNALKYAWEHNVLIVAAAGNSGNGANPVEYPAAYPFTISVGATSGDDVIAYFSTHNGFVEVCAPGVNILSTVPPNAYEWDGWSGTSMATPHVTAMAALLAAMHPGIANWELRSMIQNSCIELGAPGWDPYYGYGRLDALLAVGKQRPRVDRLEILTPAPNAVVPAGSIPAALWNPVAGATFYRIKATLPGGGQKLISLYDTYYALLPSTYLQPGTYTLVIEAIAGNGTFITSDSVSFQKAR
ncbi:MAG: S8 family serine peptidase [Lentisphaerae bacterium]|nr:S8 family serine peptidase [Lentisphaerota bacterium]